MDALTFLATLSTAGREAAKPAAEPSGQPKTMIVERWNGSAWTQHELTWNGTEYVEKA